MSGGGAAAPGLPALVSVIVPSWRRPRALERCLRALAAQSRKPDEVVVGVRGDDAETLAALAALTPDFPVPLRWAAATEPGVIASMSAALAACRPAAGIVAITDDDTEPRADWIGRLVACFADPRVGGAGGRDWQPLERGDRAIVGRRQWFGRIIGNHHLGSGPARDVDVLKGANCAYRAPLLRAAGFDTRLAGSGAQLYWELALCLPLRRAGWRLVYDPAIAVEHHVEPRDDGDQVHRGRFAGAPLSDATHNETLVLLEDRRGAARAAYLAWAFLVGTRHEPGFVQCLLLLLRGDREALPRWRAASAGRVRGWSRWRGAGPRALRIPEPPQ
ncbi:MAG: glycosyltransferase [Gemmatimonadales bacterium]